MQVRIGSDGKMHCIVAVSGVLEADLMFEPILLFSDLDGHPERVRVDGVHWLIQEKMGFNLWWMLVPPKRELFMPLESRGSIDLERVQSQQSPEGALGLALSSFKRTEAQMSYFLLLDLVKR